MFGFRTRMRFEGRRSEAPLVSVFLAGLGGLRKHIARETQRKRQSSVQQRLLCRRERTDEACEGALGKTHELVAMNAALVLQAFLDTNVNLSV
jgi:hypothetical protein